MKIYLKTREGHWSLFEGDLSAELAARGIVLGEGATIGEWATIGKGVHIGWGAHIGEWATIGEWAIIGGGVHIGEGATISEGVYICEKATIGKGAKVKDTYACATIGGLGSRQATLTGYIDKRRLIVATGCFIGTAREFLKRVREKHKGTVHEAQYTLAVAYFKKRFQSKKETK